MPTPSSLYVRSAGRELHVTDWQPAPGQRPRGTVVAWHGLTRTNRDMNDLALHLAAQGWRVI